MKKIVFLKGEATSGKSTAFRNLRKRKEMEGWVFLEHPELKSWFEGIPEKRDIQKKSLFALMKECMKFGKNIIVNICYFGKLCCDRICNCGKICG